MFSVFFGVPARSPPRSVFFGVRGKPGFMPRTPHAMKVNAPKCDGELSSPPYRSDAPSSSSQGGPESREAFPHTTPSSTGSAKFVIVGKKKKRQMYLSALLFVFCMCVSPLACYYIETETVVTKIKCRYKNKARTSHVAETLRTGPTCRVSTSWRLTTRKHLPEK